MLTDLRLALRAIQSRPAYAALIAGTLALGLGATIAVFSVMRAVLWRELPFAAPERVLVLGEVSPSSTGKMVSPVSFNDWELRQTVFSELAAFRYWEAVNLEDAGHDPEAVTLVGATANFFRAVGIAPALGRTFKDEQSATGGSEAVISDEFWARHYGRDPNVLGRIIRVRGTATTIVGVMPPVARALSIGWADVWTCLYRYNLPQMRATKYRARYLMAVGRLRPDVSEEAAVAQMRTLQRQLWNEPTSVAEGHDISFVRLADALYGDVRLPLAAVTVGVALLLLVTCANVATLMVVRGATRRRETALRLTLGAGPLRIARTLLFESALLAVAGATGGVVLAAASLPALRSLGSDIPRLTDASISLEVTAFAAALALLVATGVTGVLLLDIRRRNFSTALSEISRGGTAGRRTQRLQQGLVGFQVGLASLLLIVGGLMVRSFTNLLRVEPGFESSGAVMFDVFLPNSRYRDETSQGYFYRELMRELEANPGISAAGGLLYFPFKPKLWTAAIELEGSPVLPEQQPVVYYNEVSGSYFTAMGIPLKSGRLPTEQEMWEDRATQVAVINEAMAKQLFGDTPLGRRFRSESEGAWLEVIGVVGNVRQQRLDVEPAAEYYTTFAQSPFPFQSIVVRGRDARTALSTVRTVMARMDPGVAVANLMPLDDYVRIHSRTRAFALAVLSAFAFIALSLGVIGVYGIMSHAVGQRRRELGVRLALGATPGNVQFMVIAQGLRIIMVGTLAGVVGAMALAPITRGLLFGVSPLDPYTLIGIVGALSIAGVTACWWPARVAANVSVTDVLKSH